MDTSTFIGLLSALLLALCSLSNAEPREVKGASHMNLTESAARKGKALSIFQIVRFPNDGCQGSARNGTCYTSEECTNLGGASSGSCAQGFGVCCVFSIGCGGSSSQNCTYIVQSSVTSLSTNPCTYTICKCSSNICRIRFDFNTFTIADPEAGTAVAAAASTAGTGAQIGDCLNDQFSITSPGNRGSPIICGSNSGQHMTFVIKPVSHSPLPVQQQGPDSCLQYFTGTSGTIASYNFPTGTVGSGATHLSDQCYSICIRRESGRCAICFTPTKQMQTPSINDQASFGLSISNIAAAAVASVETLCTTDYIVIPGATDVTPAATLSIGTIPRAPAGRICGRVFSATQDQTAAIAYAISITSVCTQLTPFRIDVKFDTDEVATGATSAVNENDVATSGTVGFSLDYQQISC